MENERNISDSSGNLFPNDIFSIEEQRNGAIILHIIGIIYMFYALALVCDEYFVPSLDVISEKLKISPDVAGATFMAAGGSAPELFTSIIGVFIAKNDVGIGTIVGSAVFNILFVIAACAFAAKEALSLTAWPLVRDVFFYSISLILLVLFFLDNIIDWWESSILILWYISYVTFMKFNECIEEKLRQLLNMEPLDINKRVRGYTLRDAKNRKGLLSLMSDTLRTKSNNEHVFQHLGQDDPGNEEIGLSQLKNHLQRKDQEIHTDEDCPVEEETEETVTIRLPREKGIKNVVMYIITIPLLLPLWLTLPDTKKKKRRHLYLVTFVGSIIWIAIFSYLMVWWATVAGNALRIPAPVMGLTFLAAGTSVPDLITSVLVAKQGKGDMAVSSSVGSNIFDVTIGLPLPWLIFAIAQSSPVDVLNDGIGCTISLLFFMLIAVFLSIVIFRWKMTKGMGIMMLCLYIVFLILTLGLNYDYYPCIIQF